MTENRDQWDAGSAYEEFMGRWSRRLAVQFVSWLKIPHGAYWLDVGCGTGSLASAICKDANPASVVGCDPAIPFVQFAREHCRDERASFVAAGVGNLPRRHGGYSCVASMLALNFFPNAEAAVHEMRSVASRQGAISACVWDYSEGMRFLRHFWDAAAELDTVARQMDEGVRFPLCRQDALIALFRSGGLDDVRCDPIEIPTTFRSFDDFWRPFLGGTGPAPSYVASLDGDRRARLAKNLERALHPGPDGSIELSARAWAVHGTVK